MSVAHLLIGFQSSLLSTVINRLPILYVANTLSESESSFNCVYSVVAKWNGVFSESLHISVNLLFLFVFTHE